jgi:hypothetical protein
MEYIFIIFALAISFSQAVLSADDSDSELLRVKEALVEAAMEKGVSVVSNAYIDGNGELIESSFYRSGATLRGIRMPQYFTDEPYDATMLFSDTAFNASLSCQELSPHKYRKAISIDTTSVILENIPDQEFEAILASLRSEITMSATSAITENSNYYVIPISYERNMISSQYEAALRPRPNSADPKNTNFIIKAEITNLRPVNYSPEGIYNQGLVQAQRVGKFVANGFKNVLKAYPERAASSAPSFDFDVEISFQRADGLSENAEKVINKKVVALRFDRGENKIKLREPLVDRLINVASRINNQDLAVNEPSASARDLAFITASFRSVLADSVEQVNCEVEELKTYRLAESEEGALKLNQGLVAGINIGDRFILSESNFSSSLNPISSNQLENLAIAEVIRTEQYSADLRILEGPNQDLFSLSAIPF